jgi:hypothetical protein
MRGGLERSKARVRGPCRYNIQLVGGPALGWKAGQPMRRPWRNAKVTLGIAGNANVRVGSASIAKTPRREKRVNNNLR